MAAASGTLSKQERAADRRPVFSLWPCPASSTSTAPAISREDHCRARNVRLLRCSRRRGHLVGLIQPAAADQSSLAPENLITLPHFSVSSTISSPKSAGEPASAVPPMSASHAFILESRRATLISLLSLSTISAGASLGIPTPYQ